jgi:DNA-binding transcriptional LysR family regulator
VELSDLRAFVEAARQGTFTAAAAGLFTTQPALSRRIARLERELGGVLFDRVNRRAPRLSPLGDAILPHAEHLLAEYERFAEAARAVASGQQGVVTVAMSQQACSYSLASFQERLDRFLPGVTLQVVESQPGLGVRTALLTSIAELGLLDPEFMVPELEGVTFGFVEHVAVGLPEFLGDQNVSIEWHELRNKPLLLTMAARDLTYPMSGEPLNVVHEQGSPGLVYGFARAGRGVAILPGMRDAPGLTVRRITASGVEQATRVQLAWRRGTVLSMPARALIDSVRSRLLDGVAQSLSA